VSEELGRYLRDGPDQQRLLAAMAAGHARYKHGGELGSPEPSIYKARVRAHLESAPIAAVTFDPKGQRSYLLADAGRNQVAWIAPHKEQRSTFFQPRRGVDEYVRRQRAFGSARPLDIGAIRGAMTREPTRAVAHAITSVQRAPRGTERGR
jgi:hypothetical protein